MKNLALIFACSLISIFAFSQGATPTLNTSSNSSLDRSFYPDASDLGITANITGLINAIQTTNRTDLRGESALTLRYVKSEKLTFRIGLSPLVNRHTTNSTDSIGKDLVRYDSTSSQSTFSIRPGVEYHFKGTKRLDPYVSADVEFGLVGGMNIGVSRDVQDTTGTAQTTRTITEDGGFSVGAKLGLGMNYYISKKLFIGAEYGMGFYSIASGGDKQDVTQFRPVSGSAQTTRVLSSTRVVNSNLFVDPMIQLTFGYFFSL
jgi:hypothetical protein